MIIRWSNFQEIFCIYESTEDGQRSGLKLVVEVIHIKQQILLRTEVYKKCLIGTRATGCITLWLREMNMFVNFGFELQKAFIQMCFLILDIEFCITQLDASPFF
jgi:hypothetical protein